MQKWFNRSPLTLVELTLSGPPKKDSAASYGKPVTMRIGQVFLRILEDVQSVPMLQPHFLNLLMQLR
jgi:hypothetical protein